MTNDNTPAPSENLPTFSVNVTETGRIRNQELSALLQRFRRGEAEPLIFGDDNKPEAAIVPFAALVRLMKYDHAAYVRDENAFQAELSRRVAESDARRGRGEEAGQAIESDDDFYDWAESLGPVGKAWADAHRARDGEPRAEE
ncbi:hypothetical protein [Streptomyces sp. NPDC052042]|uniref:hypothetical protein n=1 Tax=Streptomyces sp. NPDC052042 TaxID=3365683 RepID=UPI0037CD944E